MQIVTSPPKKNISFYFSLAFGQRGSSWALVSIPVVVSFQALAWVLKDNNPEYVCAYCRKICTKLYWNYIWKQPTSLIFDVVCQDESEAENVDELKDALVIPDEHV